MAPIIQVRWSSLRRAALLACLGALAASAQSSLDALAAAYRKTPNARTRAAVLRYTDLHRSDKNGALALLVLGVTEIEQRQFGDALQHLKAAEKRLPQLGDYAAYLSGESESELRVFGDVEKAVEPVWHFNPASPLAGKAAILLANAYLEDGKPGKASALVQQHLSDLSEPQAELLLARSAEADGNQATAADHYQKIFVYYPLSKEASDAEAALARFPALPPTSRLTRGLKLLEGGDYSRAAKELSAVAPQLNGTDLDLAQVRIGVARYSLREYKSAYEHLNSFQAAAPESEAERLYYLLECARRLDRMDEMSANLEKLSTAYPQSRWRLQGLLASANYYSAHNQPENAEPLYRACSDSFAGDARSAPCQWKVAWAQYLRDPASTASLFEEHLKRYPDSERAGAALYFLGRIAESKSDWGAARAYYDAINNSYPNYYYAMLARERLASPSVASATRSAEASQFLSAIRFPKPLKESFEASALTEQRIGRARLLASAGLDDMAEAELRFGAKADGQPQIMAVELAELANRRESPDQGIRFIKHYAPGYLSFAPDAAPDRFWRLAFPMPYRSQLEEYCRSLSLDPFLMAALIRQESEFNPKAVSRASARGLTQVMPSTGRQLSRKLGIRGYRTSMLFSPDTNLKIGTYYLKALSDQLQGQWEVALASYNAGKSRVTSWMNAANFHEPAEFVESIPITETRQYVQSVLRNAEVYRRLYGAKPAAASNRP
ncbi:MAG TPA: transglycosylase SLT domain-containing protein [Bryobacteraceae bacterium]|nr:transglycosylase SLT domain-containing protein [Bryobacteraceae bacterium]